MKLIIAALNLSGIQITKGKVGSHIVDEHLHFLYSKINRK